MTQRRVVSARIVAVLALLGVLATWASARQHPLTQNDIKDLAGSGVPEGRLIDLLEEQGIGFVPTREALEELRRGGVPSAVVKAVSKQVPRGQSQEFYFREGDRLNRESRTEEAAAYYKMGQEQAEAGAAERGGAGAARKVRTPDDAPATSGRVAAKSADSRGAAWLGAALDDSLIPLLGQQVQAVEVVDLAPDGPATEAGLEEGDFIVAIQGRPVRTAEEVQKAVRARSPGSRLLIGVLRDGQKLPVTVTLGATPKGAAPIAQLDEDAGLAGPGETVGHPGQTGTGIFINGRELTLRQVQETKATYGFVAPRGRYWYDPRSGLWGLMGREAAGLIRPGHDFGPMPSNPSNGNTGVFINGREINMVEAMYCQRLFGAVYQGRWWLDGTTGNLGLEGNPMPIANVFTALQQAQRSGQQGSYSWHSNVTGAYGGSSGGCSYVSIPGSGTVMSGNCD